MSKIRECLGVVNGMPTSDGAGVSLLRVVGTPQIDYLDPFLMLDEFKNDDPGAYVAGFPEHPHRGFETVSYMKQGAMKHHDSGGNEGIIHDGGVQWMTAGRGIIHSEMPQQTEGLLWGYQLWVNLPAEHKMTAPRYQDIQSDDIPEVKNDALHVRVMAGHYQGVDGASQTLWPVEYMDVMAQPGAVFTHDVPAGHNVMVFVYEGEMSSGDKVIGTHQLGVFAQDGVLTLSAGATKTGCLIMAGKPIGEPVAKMGPFVMNTEAEIRQAVQDYRAGRFAN